MPSQYGELRQSPVMAIDDPIRRLFFALVEQSARDLSDSDTEAAQEAAAWLTTEAAPVLAAEFGIDAGAVDQMIDYRSQRRNRYTTLIAAALFDGAETGTGAKRGRFCGRQRHG